MISIFTCPFGASLFKQKQLLSVITKQWIVLYEAMSPGQPVLTLEIRFTNDTQVKDIAKCSCKSPNCDKLMKSNLQK